MNPVVAYSDEATPPFCFRTLNGFLLPMASVELSFDVIQESQSKMAHRHNLSVVAIE